MCIVSFCGSIKQSTLCCWHKPQSKPTEMLLLFGYGWSLIDQIPDIWSIRGSSSTKTKAFLVLVDAVAKIFLLFRPTQRIMTCNAPQLQLAWYLVDAVAMLLVCDMKSMYDFIRAEYLMRASRKMTATGQQTITQGFSHASSRLFVFANSSRCQKIQVVISKF